MRTPLAILVSSSVSQRTVLFHDLAMLLIGRIFALVRVLGVSLVLNGKRRRTLTDHQALEFTWTVLPRVCLAGLAVPSLRLLYVIDDTRGGTAALKAVGHQWY